jgi:tRNA-specific 2-thiouridylase
MHSTKKKIAVAMSGGVDSSLAAALLKEQGYEVIGLWMSNKGEGDFTTDPSYRDARTVAENLEISLTVVDLRPLFREEIISYFLREYLAGRTPNPCAVCNPRIKFGALLEQGMAMGAEGFATGHYARVQWDPVQERYILLRGVDKAKDQSYFLWGLSQEQLAHCHFPNGELTKKEVREMARSRGLPIAERSESQEICFIPEGDYRSFLREQAADEIAAQGDIVALDGRVLGRHQGIFGFTIGQRRGINLPAHAPYYVLRIEPAANRVVVGSKEDLLAQGLVANTMRWVSISPPQGQFGCLGQIRYRHQAAACQVIPCADDTVVVRFDEAQEAITPGQALVLYDDDRVLGGGWIQEVLGDEA